MKLRESGMPEEEYWETLLDPETILARFQLGPTTGDVVELGCGYGTFTLPLARRIAGSVHALDIDLTMLDRTSARAAHAGIKNITVAQRDVLAEGYGLPDRACDVGLLFNILHGESPIELLRETARVVRLGGHVGRDPLEERHRHATRTERGHPAPARTNRRMGQDGRWNWPNRRTI